MLYFYQPFDCTNIVWKSRQYTIMICAYDLTNRHGNSKNHLFCLSYDAILEQDLNLSPFRQRADALRVLP